jgi:xanthine dehydrogenase molybdopterin-binding subunit B
LCVSGVQLTKEQAGSTRTGIVTDVRRSVTGRLIAVVCAAFYLGGVEFIVVLARAETTFSTLLVGFAGMLVGFAGMTVVAVTMLVQSMAEKRKRRIEQR